MQAAIHVDVSVSPSEEIQDDVYRVGATEPLDSLGYEGLGDGVEGGLDVEE